MKSGNFRYEPLLKYKVFIEEEKMNELAKVAERLEMEEKRLFSLEEIRRHASEELSERQTRHIVPHEIFMYQTYLQHINIEIELQNKRVLEARSLYEENRESLIAATQDKKIIEKVKEKDMLKMIEAEKKAEKKVLDETGRNSYVRENC